MIARQSPSQTEAIMTTMVSARIEGTRLIKSRLEVRDLTGALYLLGNPIYLNF